MKKSIVLFSLFFFCYLQANQPSKMTQEVCSPTVFFLVKAGLTDWSSRGLVVGWRNISLSPQGEEQIKQLSEKLKGISFQGIFSSDLQRAYQSAIILDSGRLLPIIKDKRLRDRSYGIWEGSSLKEYKKAPEIQKWDVESNEKMYQRVLDFFQKTAQEYPKMNLLVVSHDEVLKAMLSHLLRSDDHDIEIYLEDQVILELTFCANRWAIRNLQGVQLQYLERRPGRNQGFESVK